MKVYIYFKYNNKVVLQTYLDIIKKAFEHLGYTCLYVEELKEIDKDSILVFPMAKDACKYYLQGYRNIIIWMQGATGEESFLRHHSKLRRFLLNCVDCWSIKKTKLVFFVSDNLKKYYEDKCRCLLDKKSYIMPCFNETNLMTSLLNKNYNIPSFAYVGSISVWQKFDYICELFKSIQLTIPEACFKVLTFNVEEARSIAESKGINNIIVKSVSKDEVVGELADVSYGFIVREDIIVNQVATPTKFSSYLAAGVIPIFSECLNDFKNKTDGLNCRLCIGSNRDDSVKKIVDFVKKPKINMDIKKDIETIFNSYYNEDKYVHEISALIESCNIERGKL